VGQGVKRDFLGGVRGFPGRVNLQVRKWLPGKTSREGYFFRFKKVFPGRL